MKSLHGVRVAQVACSFCHTLRFYGGNRPQQGVQPLTPCVFYPFYRDTLWWLRVAPSSLTVGESRPHETPYSERHQHRFRHSKQNLPEAELRPEKEPRPRRRPHQPPHSATNTHDGRRAMREKGALVHPGVVLRSTFFDCAYWTWNRRVPYRHFDMLGSFIYLLGNNSPPCRETETTYRIVVAWSPSSLFSR